MPTQMFHRSAATRGRRSVAGAIARRHLATALLGAALAVAAAVLASHAQAAVIGNGVEAGNPQGRVDVCRAAARRL